MKVTRGAPPEAIATSLRTSTTAIPQMSRLGSRLPQIATRELPRQRKGARRSRAELVPNPQGRPAPYAVKRQGEKGCIPTSATRSAARSQGKSSRNGSQPRSVSQPSSVSQPRSVANPRPVPKRSIPATRSATAPASDSAGAASQVRTAQLNPEPGRKSGSMFALGLGREIHQIIANTESFPPKAGL